MKSHLEKFSITEILVKQKSDKLVEEFQFPKTGSNGSAATGSNC